MRTLMLGLVLVVALVGSAAAQSGLEMRGYCEPVLRADSSGNISGLRSQSAYDAGRCFASFDTLSWAIIFAPEGQLGSRRSCLPDNAMTGQLVRVFTRYADTHPEELHRAWFPVALKALAEAFPCPEGG